MFAVSSRKLRQIRGIEAQRRTYDVDVYWEGTTHLNYDINIQILR